MSTAQQQYMALAAELDALIISGTDDSPEGDALRDQMDVPWYAMTGEERRDVEELLAEEKVAGGTRER